MPFSEACAYNIKCPDIRADNIMFGLNDLSILEKFEQGELSNPSPRKQGDGRIIYASRELETPKSAGAPILCDFGSALSSDVEYTENVQPDIYRAPEVILEVPWTSRIDIWNIGCMVSKPFSHKRNLCISQV